MFVGWVLYACGSGIDFTDEGYYLNWIAHPELYAVSHTQFGFLFNPLYHLLGEDLVLLRQANVLIFIGVSWAFFSILLLGRARPTGIRSAQPWVGLAFVLSVSSLVIFYIWLPTPNYNTLALQGLLLGGCGWGLVQIDSRRAVAWGFFLLGIGAWLTFMAKPTTAFIAGLLFFTSLAARRQLAWRPVAIAIITAGLLLLVSAWLIDSSVLKFAERMRGAAADMEKMQGKYTLREILRFDNFNLTHREITILWVGAVFVFLGGFLARSTRRPLQITADCLTLVTLIAFLSTVGFYFFCRPSLLNLFGFELTPLFSYSSAWDWMNNFPFAGVQLLAWPLGALLVFLIGLRQRPNLSAIVAALCFLALPYAYVFGTNGNYWSAMGGAAVFWCAGGLILLWPEPPGPIRWPQFLPFTSAILAGTVIILALATEAPYRQAQPLRKNQISVQISGRGSLRVPAGTAAYINEVARILEQNGFQPGDPVIDLTGHYPTLLHLIGASPIGLAWLPGGYGGSEAVTQSGLDRVPREDLRRAWVLSEPEGLRNLPPQLLQRYDLDLQRDYEEVGTVDSPVADYSRSFKQHLLKPKIPRLRAGN